MNHPYADMVTATWMSLQKVLTSREAIDIDGHTLTLSDVVAVCMYGASATLTMNETIIKKMQESVEYLDRHLQRGQIIYGVNTGFGGSADTRTSDFETLQIALQQHLNVGILLPTDKKISNMSTAGPAADGLRSHALPVPVVRAMMLIRCNSLMRGHSGVRMSTVDAIMALLERGMTPVVPLRGSISASGDLSPLSYIAGALEGNPDIFIRIGHPGKAHLMCMPADKALEYAGLRPTHLQAKEGLGIMNGTATSCAAACVAIHEAQYIALLVQVLTAMGTEALLGTADNYHPFISECRPHPGQKEAAAIIRALLSGSKLATIDDARTVGLAQDRYALRTAPQWIGPYLEDLMLASSQIQTEMNATTDNPLINVENNSIHHGGNFQATSITSAMEKTMNAMQMFGKLLYAQSSELVNNMTNKGLPPNLSVDDPSLSFTFKGFDVNMAAYMSELAYLAHPISSHVQSAEMHNQSVNSLALIAARYTLEAVEVVSLMGATYLYALCQALDLRSLHLEFVKAVKPAICEILKDVYGPVIPEGQQESFSISGWKALLEKWSALAHLDLKDRAKVSVTESVGSVVGLLSSFAEPLSLGTEPPSLRTVEEYQERAADTLIKVYESVRGEFLSHQSTGTFISQSSELVYSFVRNELRVPIHRGLADHPSPKCSGGGRTCGNCTGSRKIIGTYASDIYLALRDGRLYGVIMEALQNAPCPTEVSGTCQTP
ncbi:putative phenylalanine ammonia-lyase [Mytilinidion resinicola]|uniref:Phenylalanine ammonia-lyase n=1 Tax=Mytilinidion resinicola TaxID=574789 RepID=A0A6A6Y8U3_9PEZI|nr:putative phenylalanine ammonia-lyase [Mytilinidion resinicola]KAF2805110.1 putative phenylalanine ammonia-lyase [Mytilinidion resinicola]